MSQRNVDCLRRMVDAYNARDFDTALSLRSSGVAVDTEAAWVWRFQDGLAVEHRECRTMDEALMLVGEPSFAERPS